MGTTVLRSAFKNSISNSLFIVEAKPVKSRITENLTTFQIKLIRRLIYVKGKVYPKTLLILILKIFAFKVEKLVICSEILREIPRNFIVVSGHECNAF